MVMFRLALQTLGEYVCARCGTRTFVAMADGVDDAWDDGGAEDKYPDAESDTTLDNQSTALASGRGRRGRGRGNAAKAHGGGSGRGNPRNAPGKLCFKQGCAELVKPNSKWCREHTRTADKARSLVPL